MLVNDKNVENEWKSFHLFSYSISSFCTSAVFFVAVRLLCSSAVFHSASFCQAPAVWQMQISFFLFLCETLTDISCVCICTHGRLGDSGTVPVQRLLSQSVQTERRTNLQRRCCVFSELDMNKLHRCSRFHKMRILTKEPNRPMQTVIFHVLRGCLYLSKRSWCRFDESADLLWAAPALHWLHLSSVIKQELGEEMSPRPFSALPTEKADGKKQKKKKQDCKCPSRRKVTSCSP